MHPGPQRLLCEAVRAQLGGLGPGADRLSAVADAHEQQDAPDQDVAAPEPRLVQSATAQIELAVCQCAAGPASDDFAALQDSAVEGDDSVYI